MTGAERVAIDVEAVTAEPASDAFLSVRDLQVQFPTEDGIVQAVNGINLDLARGQTLGIVGERSEEHTSELQSHVNLVCRLLLEKKKNIIVRGYCVRAMWLTTLQ